MISEIFFVLVKKKKKNFQILNTVFETNETPSFSQEIFL